MCVLASAKVEAEIVVARNVSNCACVESCIHDETPFEVTVSAVVGWDLSRQEFTLDGFTVVHMDERNVGSLTKAESIEAEDALITAADNAGVGNCAAPSCFSSATSQAWLCDRHEAQRIAASSAAGVA